MEIKTLFRFRKAQIAPIQSLERYFMKSLTPTRRILAYAAILSIVVPSSGHSSGPPRRHVPTLCQKILISEKSPEERAKEIYDSSWQPSYKARMKNHFDSHQTLFGNGYHGKLETEPTQAIEITGKYLIYFRDNAVSICKARQKFAENLNAFLSDLRKNEQLADTNKEMMCRDSFDSLGKKHVEIGTALKGGQQIISEAIRKVEGEAVAKIVDHRNKLNTFSKRTDLKEGGRPYVPKADLLWKDYADLWGDAARTKNFGVHSSYNAKEGDGMMGSLIAKLKKEIDYFKEHETNSKSMQARMAVLKAKCEGIENVPQGGDQSPDDSGKTDPLDTDSDGTPDSEDTDDDNDNVPDSEDADPLDPLVPGDTTQGGGWGVADPVVTPATDNDHDGDGIPNDQDPDYPPKGETPPPQVETESWMSKNKNILILGGAGAAAVGGLLYYKKQEDKKQKMENWNMNAEVQAMLAAQKASSTTTSTSTSTSTDNVTSLPPVTATPQGSKIVVKGGIPAGAQTNSNITPVTVSIVTANGASTQDSGTPITVSCAVPSPCSITGTLTVNTSGGSATFSNIRFMSPDKGVKLMFTAPGFSTSTSENAFDVTDSGSGTRQ
jgi:hypothetical protein